MRDTEHAGRVGRSGVWQYAKCLPLQAALAATFSDTETKWITPRPRSRALWARGMHRAADHRRLPGQSGASSTSITISVTARSPRATDLHASKTKFRLPPLHPPFHRLLRRLPGSGRGSATRRRRSRSRRDNGLPDPDSRACWSAPTILRDDPGGRPRRRDVCGAADGGAIDCWRCPAPCAPAACIRASAIRAASSASSRANTA